MAAVIYLNDSWIAVVGLLLLAGIVAWFSAIVRQYRKLKKEQGQQLEAMAESDRLPDPELVPAQVVKTDIHRFYTGSRRLRIYNEEYLVTFRLEDGEEIHCTVPKETYYAINEGDSGMLLHADGNFIDFGEGTECDTAE